MRTINHFILYTAITALLMSGRIVAAPDYSREKRWADEVTPSILVGSPVYLEQKNKHKFLTILAEPDNAKLAIIVVHGMGLNPDWGLIGTIRTRLYDFGYTTFSLQMPVLSVEAKVEEYLAIFPEAVERLSLAVSYLKNKGYHHIILVSHSNGSRISRIFMLNNPDAIDAWAAISLTRQETFSGIEGPILDVYGEQDLDHVLSSVSARKLSLNLLSLSKQVMLKKADHFYNGREEELCQLINQFVGSVISANSVDHGN